MNLIRKTMGVIVSLILCVVIAGASAGTTITYMASNDWVQDAEMALGQKFFDQTGITVDYQIVPSDQYINLLMTKLNAGECTDIFGSQGGQFDIVTQLNVEKNALPLSGEAWASVVDPLAAAELSVNGVLYGQPTQDVSAVWAIAYNKTIFSNLGLSVPTTYAEFKAVCQAILDSGVIPVYECVSDGWHHVLWFPEMGVALEKTEPGLADRLNRNETTFAQSAAAVTLLSQIKEMAALGYWGDNYMANAYSDGPKSVASGEYAMMVANQGFAAEVNAADPNFPAENIGFFVIPLLDNQILNVNPVGPSRFVYSGSANADAAKQYLAFLAQPENLQYMIDNVPKYNTLPFSGVQPDYSPEIKAFYDAYPVHGTVYQTLVKYLNPQWMEIGKELTAMLQGDETAEQVLQNIDRNRADQAKAAGDAYWQ